MNLKSHPPAMEARKAALRQGNSMKARQNRLAKLPLVAQVIPGLAGVYDQDLLFRGDVISGLKKERKASNSAGLALNVLGFCKLEGLLDKLLLQFKDR